jgi:hypothetical protein
MPYIGTVPSDEPYRGDKRPGVNSPVPGKSIPLPGYVPYGDKPG